MTRDDIIRMAREAGISITTNWMGKPMLTSIGTHGDVGLKGTQELERFAELIAAAEREACALAAEAVVPRHTECGNKIAAAIRAREK